MKRSGTHGFKTAFGENPYGNGTLLRLWEQARDGGTYTVRLPAGMNIVAAQGCDLRGQTFGGGWPVSRDGTFVVDVPSMSPRSLILSAGPSR